MQIPFEARRFLAENHGLAEERIEDYYKTLRRIADADDLGDQTFQKTKLEAISGGIALLVTHHRPWLTANPPTKQWCIDMLRNLAVAPLDDSHSSDDVAGTSTEAFLGEAGVALHRLRSLGPLHDLKLDGVTFIQHEIPFGLDGERGSL